MTNLNSKKEEQYWTNRYVEGMTGWDIGSPSTPIKNYIDQLENKDVSILIPGAGNAYEAEYLWNQGFKNTFVLDISEKPLLAFSKRCPRFPKSQLIQANFFDHHSLYDLVIEQTFFCSFPPTNENRMHYAQKMSTIIKPNGKLVGLWFDIPLTGDMVKRPFGGTRDEYIGYFQSFFKIETLEPCYNSIEPRKGNELFGIFSLL